MSKQEVIEIAASLIPILIKHVYRAFQRTFDWIDLAIDCVYALVSFFIGKVINWTQKSRLKTIKNKYGTGNRARNKIRVATKKLNYKVNVWGIKANLSLNLSSVFTSTIYSYITTRV